MIIGRRGFLMGLGGLLCAPAVVKASILMPVSTRGLGFIKEFAVTGIAGDMDAIMYADQARFIYRAGTRPIKILSCKMVDPETVMFRVLVPHENIELSGTVYEQQRGLIRCYLRRQDEYQAI